MSDVKTAVRTLKIFEAFAVRQSPMNLSELAVQLGAPPSSCLLLLRTLLGRGYLFETKKNTYYPTGRMQSFCAEIALNDSIVARTLPTLTHLRDLTGETTALVKRQDTSLIYLSVVETQEPIRAIVNVGTLRPLHATSTGKALLSLMSADERAALIKRIKLSKLTDRTITSATALKKNIDLSIKRGWFRGEGESFPDLGAVSIPVQIEGAAYAVAIMGPSARIDRNEERFGQLLIEAARALESGTDFKPSRLSLAPAQQAARRRKVKA